MRPIGLALLCSVAVTPSLEAQAARATLRIHVVDSARVAVAGVDISVMKGLNESLARGSTDSMGRRMLSYDPSAGDVGVVARKIGFARADRYVRAKSGDTINVEITLARTAQALDVVKITDRESLRRQSYYIDADEIANSKRPIADALDVVGKLRPDMIYGRPGWKVCPPTLRVWVNGVRIRYAARKDALIARKRMTNLAASTQSHLAPTGIEALPVFVASILSDIKAEHIAEVQYKDCMDFSMARNGGESALFIVLKPGIGFEQGVGSYVSDRGVVQSAEPELPDSLVFGAASVPSYRYRVLGIFDAATGDPLEGVSIIDVATTVKALTTVTGTVTLVFLPEGANNVRIEKTGYTSRVLELSISPRDTVPLTFLLERIKK